MIAREVKVEELFVPMPGSLTMCSEEVIVGFGESPAGSAGAEDG